MKHFIWFCSYIIEFVACSFCGWLYEILLELAVYGRYADRGLLHLPVCPIYGFFGLILVLLFQHKNSAMFVFLTSTALTTILELAASYLLEYVGYRPWDYTDWPLHFSWRISLLSSLIFGLLSLLLMKGVHPLMRKLHDRVPDWIQAVCGTGFGCILLADTMRTFLQL